MSAATGLGRPMKVQLQAIAEHAEHSGSRIVNRCLDLLLPAHQGRSPMRVM